MLPESMPLSPQKFREILEHSGLTQTQIAKQVGVERTAFSKWKAGVTAPRPEVAARLRKLIPSPRCRVEWAEFCAREQANAGNLIEPSVPVDPKALAEALANEVIQKLVPLLPKLDVEALTPIMAKQLEGISVEIAVLLPDLHQVVDGLASKVAALLPRQPNTREVASMVADALVPLLPKQDPHEVARRVAAVLEDKAQALADMFKGGLDALAEVVQGLASKVDSLRKPDAQEQERAADRAKLDELRTAMRRWLLYGVGALVGFMVVGFGAVAAVVVACSPTRAVRPVSGAAGLTRGGGVAEEATGGGMRWWWVWGAPLDPPDAGVNMGERREGRPMPHSTLPGQAVAPCRGSAETFYGSCWLETAKTAPCPPDQFQEGSRCYAPIPAKPDVPVGDQPREEPRRGDVSMPGKEQ